jgi:twitching motility protein PilT
MSAPTRGARRIDGLLEALWQARGSDLLISVGIPPQIRVHGELSPVPEVAALSTDDTEALLAELLTPAQALVFAGSHEYDFAFSWGANARIRGNAFRQRGSVAISLRLVSYEIPTLSELRCPPGLESFTRLRQGLVLMTGPTGSGKSTTLAAVINQINIERACHIITIEDPIEYVYRHQRAVVNQREVGSDTASFPAALRAALREDPDVLLVGEMRDLESIRFALTIAETGHLVFATLHTRDTAHAVGRIIDVFPGDQQQQIKSQFAASLTGIVYQQLLPRVGGGMVAAHEVLVANSAVRNLIKDGKINQLRNVLLPGRREGMQTFEQSLTELVQSGLVTFDDARAASQYPGEIHPNLRPGPTPSPPSRRKRRLPTRAWSRRRREASTTSPSARAGRDSVRCSSTPTCSPSSSWWTAWSWSRATAAVCSAGCSSRWGFSTSASWPGFSPSRSRWRSSTSG